MHSIYTHYSSFQKGILYTIYYIYTILYRTFSKWLEECKLNITINGTLFLSLVMCNITNASLLNDSNSLVRGRQGYKGKYSVTILTINCCTRTVHFSPAESKDIPVHRTDYLKESFYIFHSKLHLLQLCSSCPWYRTRIVALPCAENRTEYHLYPLFFLYSF